ncbi:transglycosylase domain-containing protein [Haloglycomyces albus]|uniref:transglycosylase domain-containing protein n=1 Tax=Haloglycomyces albus TaxID=526067 RepID=UPI00046D6A23|nr:transglycosylase domain-containing protein [Haloglycomyces albus]
MRHRPRNQTNRLSPQDRADATKRRAEAVYALLRTSLLTGVAVAALVLPIAMLGGLGAKAGFEAMDELSAELVETNPPLTSYVYADDGETLLSLFYDEFRREVSLDEISPIMRQAMVAAEDTRFYEHNGVDYRGVMRAAVANQTSGKVTQGASTITMQYVRGALQLNAESIADVVDASEKSVGRKLREARLAMSVEEQLTKDEILERYLNQAYFGHNAYGIFAAAYIYFSKHPSELNLEESALLAGLVKSPSEFDPTTSGQEAALDRRNWVLNRMIKLDYISHADASEVVGAPIKLKSSDAPNSCMTNSGVPSEYGFFCDYLRLWWRQQEAFGDTPDERERELRQGGYTIITSLNTKTHKETNQRLRDKKDDESRHAFGSVVMEPNTGRIKTLGLNRQFSYNQTNNAVHSNPSVHRKGNHPNTVNALLGGGSSSGYQAGSTFKIFTLLAALDDGYDLSYSLNSPHRVATSFVTAPGPASCGGRWCPSNANSDMAGNRTMWSGFGMSVNTFFAQLIDNVGADKTVEMAERMGLQWRTDVDKRLAKPENRTGWGPFTLGVSDAQPIELTNVYNALAGNGQLCEPLPVNRIIDRNGQDSAAASPSCHQAVDEDVALAATDAGRCVTETERSGVDCGAWGTAREVGDIVGRPVSGKTGTTDSNRASWFIGFTPDVTVGVFQADPDYMFNNVPLNELIYARETAAEIMSDYLEGVDPTPFEPPPQSIR